MRFTQPYLKAVCFFLIFWICPAALPQQTNQAAHSKSALSNQDILAMVRVQFPDSTIIKSIQDNDTDFDLSAGALVALKSAGVSQTVIEAMLAAGNNKKKEVVSQTGQMSVESLGTRSTDLLGEVGVYVVQGIKLTPVEPEIVNWRTGGVLKSIATVGLDKGHVNGTAPSPWDPRPTMKADTSILLKRRHFYFALTQVAGPVDWARFLPYDAGNLRKTCRTR